MTKKKKQNRGKGSVNKSDFIRARPTATPQEIVDAAKAEGIEISRNAIHKVRWQLKQHEILHPSKKSIAPNKWKAKLERANERNGKHLKSPPVLNGNGHAVEALEGEWKGLDEAAAAVLGASIGNAVKQLVRNEVRAEVRRIMARGAEA